MKARIFNIQKCSIHDGPGLRTTVFLKGCRMKCLWCSNPESQNKEQELMIFPNRCIMCGRCIRECPENAVHDSGHSIDTDFSRCTQCFRCVEKCYADARSVVGEDISCEQLFEKVCRDNVFWQNSAGGVTFSGGEPFLQPEFIHEFAGMCRQRDISLSVETCAFADYEKFRILHSDFDLMHIDVKHTDSLKHREYTGVPVEMILENIRKMDTWNVPFIIRTPVIPGFNDTAEAISGIAGFCSSLKNIRAYELLRYHDLGKNKYGSLGREYPLKDIIPPDKSHMRSLVSCACDVLKNSSAYCFYHE